MTTTVLTITLSLETAETLAEATELLADIDEGENTDYDSLKRAAEVLRHQIAQGIRYSA